MIKVCRLAGGLAVTAVSAFALLAGSASAKMIFMPTLQKETQIVRAHHAVVEVPSSSVGSGPGITPPAPPCPESGQLPSAFSNCGLPEFPAAGTPYPGNMSYWGGWVQTHPHIYLVYWGWGGPGAFPAKDTCAPETITEGSTTATLPCDPDGAGKYMADWVNQMSGSAWAKVADQYYQTNSDGSTTNVDTSQNMLAGIWVDEGTPSVTVTSGDNPDLTPTSSSATPGPGNTYTDMAAEAAAAAQHFGVSGDALKNANFVIIQPPNYSDPNALSAGYCAFHDLTYPGIEGGIYNGITQGIAYTNMPYSLDLGAGCGQNSVNPAPQGNLDGYSIILGHEILETVTDPGAEVVLSTGPTGTQTYLGGWYDPADANENGDKCAWVGDNLVGIGPEPLPIPGAIGNATGNQGGTFAVQSTWSNQSAGGAGYCAGAGTDLPSPLN